jgi:hypothetical protein
VATFTVDPATLRELSGTLSGIHSQMQSMHGVASGYEGLLGGSDLDGDVEHFCSHWGYGIGKLADHMTKVVQRLDAAAASYGTSEQAIENACAEGEGHG